MDVKVSEELIEKNKIFLREWADIRVDDIRYRDTYDQKWKSRGIVSSQVSMVLEILLAAGIINVDEENQTISINDIKGTK